MAHRRLIIEKIGSILDATDQNYDQQLTAMVDQATRIFIAGAGRSALVARFFAMRLMHGGYNVFVVGEIVTPSLSKGDLLIVISGSGETETMIAFAKRAKELGGKLVLISSRTSSTLGDMSDTVIPIGQPDLYGKVVGMPMGTVFELSTLVFLEATVSHIIHEKGIAEEEMRARHANLE
ncbi:MAG: 6-phospho-3-hexuloisomerase [Gammaproteobacteria bacterium]|jgi:6-phospho 3-hexuloisomerase|nr:6-phospho-3-hexuloisomerase [Gammaproteobacteria bacterium]NBT43769.1 6-phospho-3-hexuloisomerase [Gammaproteobacteria bacterium]NBY24095.1 6-phospho-3-hexuloisomerase [Gammaproteobacteria bacterium]NDE34066.1 6-phospho-3-hexuloisomerase [Gammaproteobacteria bacterium]NDE55878.1 6-phospho-3-hexuloisomerase [Gammaproteobacteria bacterium]